MSFLTSTRFLFFSTATVGGGAAIGGLAFYNAIKKDNETTKQMLADGRDFWDRKLSDLEKELVKLKAENKGKDKELTEKIVKDISKNSFFDLDNKGEAFNQKHKSDAQRIALASFCKDSESRKTINVDLAKRLCDKEEAKKVN